MKSHTAKALLIVSTPNFSERFEHQRLATKFAQTTVTRHFDATNAPNQIRGRLFAFLL
jgi:hypothetical protein